MKHKYLLLLGFIVLVAAVLRFYQLADVPVGFHRDEAFLGYNGYSILQTGRSMSSDLLPTHLPSFLYSPAGYSYASIPFIALFGLSEFSVRGASAFFGVLSVVVLYFFVKELLFRNKVEKESVRECVALLSSGLLAIMPWHINLSRTSTENTIVTFLLIVGIWMYLLWYRKGDTSAWKSKRVLLLLGSFASFGTTFLLYQAPRAFLPLFVPLLVFLYAPKRISARIFLGALYFVVILLPLFYVMTAPKLSLRIKTVSLFASEQVPLLVDEQLREDGVMKTPVLLARVYHNKAVGYTDAFLQNYAAHFSYPFLFTDKGFPDRYRVSGSGIMYLWTVPFLIFGFWSLFSRQKKAGLLLAGWILLVPVGSAMAFDDVPNLQRTLMSVPAYMIVIALGILFGYVSLKQKYARVLYVLLLGIIIIFSFSRYIYHYYVNQIVHVPIYRHEGYEELVEKVSELLPMYDKAVITNRESAPTIFFLFYNKVDPVSFQNQVDLEAVPDYDRMHFDKFEFSTDQCPLRIDLQTGSLTGDDRVLYANHATCGKMKDAAKLLYTIQRPDGTDIFYIVTHPDK